MSSSDERLDDEYLANLHKLYAQDDKLTAKGFYNEIVRPYGRAIFFIVLLFPVFFGVFVGLMADFIGIAFYPPCWMFGILGLFIC